LVVYFETRDLAGITIFAALWGVLNAAISPVFFRLFQLPFFCDLIGFAALILAVWWVRKIGTATFVGVIATVINFMFRPDAVHFLGFTAASVLFDVIASLTGYRRLFEKRLLGSVTLLGLSIFSAATAGLIIGAFFMEPGPLQRWGGIIAWSGLHAIGGVIGGTLGVTLVNALTARGITAKSTQAGRGTRKEIH
jgi:hypothetical protein